MAATFKLPKREVESAVVLNTALAADADLTTGLLTVLDESGATGLSVKISDCLGWAKDVFTAGTAHVVDVDLTAASLVNNGLYSLSVVVPNIVRFFGGGNETSAVYITRTYNVSTDASATVGELQTELINAINADIDAGITAASAAGDIVRITADSADAGKLIVTTGIIGATIADQTAYVAPVGTELEVKQHVLNSNLVAVGGEYTRWTLRLRKSIRHNAVAGLEVVKPVDVYVYSEENAAGHGAFETALDEILDGTATAADYLGVPSL